ncbi:hypothetical protein COCON_G00136190 [Conger conger]|uniref:Uncharacterized protein n=1 Tax=Conger conger TaxID=82655 RepID=A0A9Q1DET6_CONCO|nr:hypothetical protein COCON_G00136190 [Conger conger]
MCRSLLFLLLIAGALLISTEGQQDYHKLTDKYKAAVDKAIQHCNEKSSKHVNFLGFLPDSEKSDPFYIELHLKVTTCTKTEKTTHRDDCPFMDRRPKINCAVCNKGTGSGLDIHCAAQLQVIKFMEERRKLCSIYIIGAGSLSDFHRRTQDCAPTKHVYCAVSQSRLAPCTMLWVPAGLGPLTRGAASFFLARPAVPS